MSILVHAARLTAAAAIAGVGGAAALYLAVASAFEGSCGELACADQQEPSLAGQLALLVIVLVLVIGVMLAAGRVAVGAERARALGRLRFAALSVLLVPMYPFAAWGTLVASRHVRLDMTSGFAVVVGLVALYLSGWAAVAGLVARRRPVSLARASTSRLA
jgi:hypothetical protein